MSEEKAKCLNSVKRALILSIFIILLVILVGCRGNSGGNKPMVEGHFTHFTADGKEGEILSGTKKVATGRADEKEAEGMMVNICYQLNAAETSKMEITCGQFKVAAEDILYPTPGCGIYHHSIPWNRVKDNGEYEYVDIEAKVYEINHMEKIPMTLKKHFPLVLSEELQLEIVNEEFEGQGMQKRTEESSLTVDGVTYELDFFYYDYDGYHIGGILNSHLDPVPDITGLKKYKSQETGYYLIPKENSDKGYDIILYVGEFCEMDSSAQDEIDKLKEMFKTDLNTFENSLSQMNDYILTVEAFPENGGKVSLDNSNWTASATQMVIEGNSVSVYAQAETTHTFTGWYEGGTQLSTDNPYSLTVNEERTIKARFEEKSNVPPTVEKVSGISGTTHDDSATFTWRGTDTDGSIDHYACKKDDGNWLTAEATQHSWEGYTEGNHTFSVKATDGEGAESNIITWSFEYVPEYSLRINAEPERGGDVSFDNETWTETASKTAAKGTGVAVYAKAEVGYQFDGWFEGNIFLSKSNPYTVTMNTDRNIRARYIERGVNVITVQSNPEDKGDVSFDNSSWSDRESRMVTKGTAVQLYARAEENCGFEGWYEGETLLSRNNPITILLTDNRTIEARFMDINTLTINANPAEGGDVSLDNKTWKDTDEQTVFRGTTLEIYAQASLGYNFQGWYENDVKLSDEEHFSVTVDTDRTIEARFVEVGSRTLTINATPTEGGDVSFDSETWKDSDEQTVTKGSRNTLYARATLGWLFDGWYEGDVKISNEEIFSVQADTDRTIEARFIRGAAIIITASPEEHGDISFDNETWKDTASQTVAKGEVVNLYAKAIFGYVFEGWYEEDIKVSEDNPYSPVLTEDRTLEARFIRGAAITISATPTTWGDISLNNITWKDMDSQTVEKGETVRLYARAETERDFDGWYEGNKKVSVANPYRPTLTEDRTLEARFRYASGVTIWQNNLGGAEDDRFDDIEELRDGSLIFVGSSESGDGDVPSNKGDFDGWVVKTDATGTVLWSKSYGGSQFERLEDALELGDGSLIFAGYSRSSDGDVSANKGNIDGWVIKTDATGTILWSKNYGGNQRDYFRDVVELRDGGLLFVGYSESGNGDLSGNKGLTDAWAMKTDGSGTILWSKNYGGDSYDEFYNAIELEDGTLVFAARSCSGNGDLPANKGSFDGWVLKTDSGGNILQSRNYGGSNADYIRDVEELKDGHFVFVGCSNSSNGDVPGNKGGVDGWAIKIDDAGTILWKQNYGGNSGESFWDVEEQNDGSLIFTGNSYSNTGDVSGPHGGSDGWVVRVNMTNGTVLWKKNFGGSDEEMFYTAVKLRDGNLVFAGDSDSDNGDLPGNKGGEDGYLLKLAEIY